VRFVVGLVSNNKTTLEKAAVSAINYCIANNILKEFLEEHATEVINMLMGEWDLEEAVEVAREEGREEGVLYTARNALAKGISVETVQEITGLSFDEIKRLQ